MAQVQTVAERVSAAVRAAAGANYLDGREPPGWADKIDTNILDIGDPNDCPGGQLTGDWNEHYGNLGFTDNNEDDPRTVELGFFPYDDPEAPGHLDEDDIADLTEAWIAEVKKRVLVPA